MIIIPENISGKDAYKLLCGSIVPRPIAWVSTLSSDGIANLAPFSNFMPVSWNPPMLCFSIGPGVDKNNQYSKKDTLINIEETKVFTVNIPSYPLANQMYKTGEVYAPDVDEFKEAGLNQEKGNIVDVPGVKEAYIKLECRLHKIIDMGVNKLIIGEVVCFNIDDSVYLGNYKINMDILKPIGRLAGTYCKADNYFEIP